MARRFMLDSSALVKRYTPETGTANLNHLFAQVTSDRLACLLLNSLETVSVLVRKKNRGDIPIADYQQAIAAFRREIIDNHDVKKMSVGDSLLYASIPLIDQHAVNANDAVLLAVMKAIRDGDQSTEFVLVASDQRLFKAAQAEGLRTFNPETQTQAELDALLAS